MSPVRTLVTFPRHNTWHCNWMPVHFTSESQSSHQMNGVPLPCLHVCCSLVLNCISLTWLLLTVFLVERSHSGRNLISSRMHGRTGKIWRLRMLALLLCLGWSALHGFALVRLSEGDLHSLVTIHEKNHHMGKSAGEIDISYLYGFFQTFRVI